MRCWLGVLTVGFALAGCSGKYVVGTMDQPDDVGGMPTGGQSFGATGGTFSAAGTFPIMTAGTSAVGGSVATAGAPNLGGMPSDLVPDGPRTGIGSSCVGAMASPFKFQGPVARSDVLWQRVNKLVYYIDRPVPANLPMTLSEQQLMDLVDEAFLGLQSNNNNAGSDGAGLFIEWWLGLPQPLGDTGGNYSRRMIYDSNDVFPILLESMHIGGGIGVFTEQPWLQGKSISARGAFLMRRLFGVDLPLPPAGLMNPPPDPNLSDRQTLDKQVSAAPCSACHSLFDGPGYALDIFDSMGNYRTEDHGQAIDTSGTVRLQLEQRDAPFKNFEELMNIAENSCDATVTVSQAFLRFAMQQSGYQGDALANVPQVDQNRMAKNFTYEGRSYPSLVRAYLQTSVGYAP